MISIGSAVRIRTGPDPQAEAAASVAAIVPAGAEEAMPITVSSATPIASGSSPASMTGAGTAPGGTGAGRYVNLVSCQMPGPPRGQTPGSGKTADVVLWLRRDAGNKTRAQGHLPRPRRDGVPQAEGFPGMPPGMPIRSLQCLPVRPDLLVQPVRRVTREHLASAADRAPHAVLQDAEAVIAAISPRPLQLSQGGVLVHLEHAASPRDSTCLSPASHGRSSCRLLPSRGVWGCSLDTTVTTG